MEKPTDMMLRGCRPKNVEAEVLNIGTELTLGVTVNTNGSWLAKKLTQLGFTVRRIVVVADKEEDVIEELTNADGRYGLVVTTGGLGPTYDDRTSEIVAKAFGLRLSLHSEALRVVETAYSMRGEKMSEAAIKQALLPLGAEPIPNPTGTAPGFLLCTNRNTLIISLPGPPREMQPMFENYVEPLLRRLSGLAYYEAFVEVKKVREASVAKGIEAVARRHPRAYIKSHPDVLQNGTPLLRLQVSAFACSIDEAKRIVEEALEDLKKEVEALFGSKLWQGS